MAIAFVAPAAVADSSSLDAFQAIVDRHEARSQVSRKEPPDPAKYAEFAASVEQDFADLQAIDPLSFGDEELRIDYEVLDAALRDEMNYWGAGFAYNRVGPFWSPHHTVQDMHRTMPIRTLAELEAYAAAVEMKTRDINGTIEVMREGIALGLTPPRSTIEHIPAEIQALLDENLEHLEAPFSWMWESVPEGPRDKLWARFKRQTIPAMTRSLTRFQAFLSDEYLPKCREPIGIEAHPNGAAVYRSLLRQFAETDLPPAEIHAWGLEEVARLRKEMAGAIREMNIANLDEALEDDALVDAFYAHARNAPEFYYETEEEVLQAYRNTAKLVDHWLPTMFRKLPRLTFGVIPMQFDRQTSGRAEFRMGSMERGEASVLLLDLRDVRNHPRFAIRPIALHETVPGHHLETALTGELEDRSQFRKEVFFVGFGEGWAMYAEKLGYDMQLYNDPLNRFGVLYSELLRACRLVVDPGIHALGWSREQAMDFLRANTLYDDEFLKQELDRYIAWPAQACSYKMCERRFSAIRKKAEATLGDKFNLRDFHEAVLGAGAVPMATMERRVNAWIEKTTAQQAEVVEP